MNCCPNTSLRHWSRHTWDATWLRHIHPGRINCTSLTVQTWSAWSGKTQVTLFMQSKSEPIVSASTSYSQFQKIGPVHFLSFWVFLMLIVHTPPSYSVGYIGKAELRISRQLF